jgi:hypothetical protein
LCFYLIKGRKIVALMGSKMDMAFFQAHM